MRTGGLIHICMWLSMISPAMAVKPINVTIRDYIGVDWKDELVHYSLDFRQGELKGVARAKVRIMGGKAIPSQVTDVKRHEDGSIRSFNVWFFSSIPADKAVSYTITPGKRGPKPNGVTTTVTDEFIELTTRAPRRIGIRLPAGGNEYNWPVPARDVPGPIQALRLPSGRWIGKGRFEAPFLVKSYKASVTAIGPLFAEARIEYLFDTGYWTFTARILKNCPMIIIEEEFNTGYSGQQWDKVDRFYSLVLNSGVFKPTKAFYTGYTDKEEFHDLVKQAFQEVLNKAVGSAGGSAGTPVNGYTLSFHTDRDDYYLTPWPTYSARANTFIRFVAPRKDAVGFAALSTKAWRNPLSLRFKSNTRGELSINLPIQVYEQGWSSEGFGRYSLHSSGKTLFVPENTARRRYGIMLSRAENEQERKLESLISEGVKLGSFPLDEVKDWVLDWPDPMAGAAWAGQPTEAGRKTIELTRGFIQIIRELGNFGLFIMWSFRAMTHLRYGPQQAVINAPEKLSAGQREELRRLLAFQAYVMNSPDILPWGVGCHLGNPSKSIMAVDARTKSSTLVKDHPMFKTWCKWTSNFMKEYIRRFTRESGAMFENPNHSLDVTLTEMARANQVLMEAGIGDAFDTERFKRSMRFIMNWLTAPDPRFNGLRVILPLGTCSYQSVQPEMARLLVTYYKDRDPELAGNLQWFANQTLPEEKQSNMVKQVIPKLGSAHYQDYGVFFRHGFGTPYETLFHLLAGNCTGFYELETDQMTYTLYAKGRPIHLHFGNGQFPVFNRPWLRNRVSINHRREVPERHDAEVLAASFMPEAEYAHAAKDIDQLQGPVSEYPPGGPTLVRPFEDIPMMTWHRQVLFLKDIDPKGPNYFVLRDAFGSPSSAGQPTDLSMWFLANTMERKGNVFHYDGQCEVDIDVFVATPETFEPETGKYGHIQQPYRLYTGFDPKYFPGGKYREDQLFLRIKQAPGKGYMVVLYPRLKQNDPAAVFTRLTENAVRIETPLSVDYAFLSPRPFTYNDEKLTFQGMAGTVRLYKSGKIAVANCEGKAEVRVAGKTITGEGAFAVTLDGDKVLSKTYEADAQVNVE